VVDINDWQWLDGKEIEILAQKEQNHMLKGIEDVSVLVYEDVSVIGTDFDLNKNNLLEVAKKTMINPQHKVVFCVGTMENNRKQGGPINGSQGHWFPLVWTRERNYVMDSARNKCRLEDPYAKKMLDAFEGFRSQCNVTRCSTMSSLAGRKLGTIQALERRGIVKPTAKLAVCIKNGLE
jgi:hypothetical protein